MIQCIMNLLKTKKIVLASSSPRRLDILKGIGIDFIVCPSLFEENLDPESFPSYEHFVLETALQKVLEVDERLKKEENTLADIIIGADTMVILDGKLFGKPLSKENAFEMLTQLQGRCHTVITGVVIKSPEKTMQFTEKTNINVAKLTPKQIWAYIETGEPLDKAGSYGIQGIGGTMVEKVEGCYYNVIGLPLHKMCKALLEMFDTEKC